LALPSLNSEPDSLNFWVVKVLEIRARPT